ncbi:MAG TPA: sulfonate ABC transporter substrate-binding protein [Roseiflexaceae bacterium]|nr:sulfonate ABC transporter substrate-binding protein [Roseiflexaceae bacterium]
MSQTGFTRRARLGLSLTLLVALLAGVLVACGTTPTGAGDSAGQGAASAAGEAAKQVRIGYQKGGSLALLKAQGALEQRLQPQGVSVEWHLFSSGPPLLEAMNTGNVDLGSTGEPPPIFAQAADTPLVYVAATPPNPRSNAVIVPQDSPIQSVAELKGKKVAVAKGSSSHYLLVRALQEAGLTYADITPVFLQPGDARNALAGKSVDAWVIWDPFLAVALKEGNTRALRNGEGLTVARGFYLATRDFATAQPELLQTVLEEIDKAERWVGSNAGEAARLVSTEIGVPAEVLEQLNKQRSFGLGPVTADIIDDQQEIADLFYDLQLIPKQIQIKAAVLQQ